MNQNQNVESANNQVIVKPKIPVLLGIIIIILGFITIILSIASPFLLLGIAMWGTVISGIIAILILISLWFSLFGLANMKLWALRLLTGIFVFVPVMTLFLNILARISIGPSYDIVGGVLHSDLLWPALIVVSLVVAMFVYLWSIRKQFN